MFFKQFYDDKLSQMSYMIACQTTKDAMIIDPARILDEYEETARDEGFNITMAAETHIHADFASGLRDVSRKYDGTLLVSGTDDGDWQYKNMPEDTVYLTGGDTFQVGYIDIEVIETPGHTPESISFVLTDKGAGADQPMGVFTGDFLFVGSVGRPDLLEESAHVEGATEIGAGRMFDSLQKLEDYQGHLQIWPGHGAGSPCGKALGAVPLSTLGYERGNNWALKETDKDAFIHELTDSQPEPPTYFSQMKAVNRDGLPEFELRDIKIGTPAKLTGQIIDLRPLIEFSRGFKKGSINIPYNKKFLQFAGWYIDYSRPMTVIADLSYTDEIQRDLASIGYDGIELIVPEEEAAVYFDSEYSNISPAEVLEDFDVKNVLDVRTQSEYDDGHFDAAEHVHYGQLTDRTLPFDKEEPLYVHCQSGVRSAIAASVLKGQGYDNVVNIEHGYKGLTAEDNRD